MDNKQDTTVDDLLEILGIDKDGGIKKNSKEEKAYTDLMLLFNSYFSKKDKQEDSDRVNI